jgi:hypothetical protein
VGKRTGAHVREALARGDQEARIQLQDGTPVSAWVATPEAFDDAVNAALAQHPRDRLRVMIQGPVD